MKRNKDQLDDVAAEWARERPDLDVFPIQIFARLHYGGRFTDAFYARSVKPFGLRAADFFVLSELRRAGPPFTLSPSELSSMLVRSSGGITRQLDQLESRGWIERERDPTDRRGIRVRLSDEGLALIDEALTAHFDNEAALLSGMSKRDQERAADLLRELLSLLVGDGRSHP